MQSDSLLESLMRKAAQAGEHRPAMPSSPSAFASRCRAFRKRLIASLGFMPMPDPGSMHATVTESQEKAGVLEERIEYSPVAGRTATADVLRPARADGLLPGVIILHAWDLDKSSLGAMTREMARRGYLVLMPRNRCTYDPILIDDYADIPENDATGTTVMGMVTFDNMRAVDYLASRSDVDPERLACAGLCWTGLQSYILGAIDERLKVVCAMCGVSMQGAISTQNTFVGGHECVETFVPGLLEIGQVQDIMALIVPRPLLVMNNVNEAWAPVLGFDLARKELSAVYRSLGYPERFQAIFKPVGRDMTLDFTRYLLDWLDKFLAAEEQS